MRDAYSARRQEVRPLHFDALDGANVEQIRYKRLSFCGHLQNGAIYKHIFCRIGS